MRRARQHRLATMSNPAQPRTTRQCDAEVIALVARNCARLIWEFARYRRLDTKDGSFAVVKKDDHAMDALR